MKKVIGITGGIASGKSTVCNILIELGYPVIDSDVISRRLSQKGNSCYYAIVNNFGDDILLSDGNIDRKKLGSIIFNNKDKKELLNNVTHPLILEEIKRNIDLYDDGLVFVDIPLLYEADMRFLFDSVICVYLDKQTQITRLMNRDKIDFEYALKKIESQMDLKMKKELSEYVIDSSKSFLDTRENTLKIIKIIKGENYGSNN